MQIKNSSLKVNQYVKPNESKLSKALSDLDYGQLGVGLIGLGVCAPYLVPSIAGVQTATLIPIIAKGLTTVATCALGGIATYAGIDIIKENSKKLTPKITIKEEKEKVKVITNTAVNSQGVNVNIDDNKNKCNKNKEGVVIC